MNTFASEIVEELNKNKDSFSSFYNSGLAWQANWTKLLKTIITKLGQKKDYFVRTDGLEGVADDVEWLHDLTWLKILYNGDKSVIIDVPLVLESEISKKGFGAFKEDFDKLLIATSSLKIFVLKNDNENLLKEIIDYAQESVNKNKRISNGEGIYIIIWQEIKEKDFELLFLKKS